MNNREVTNRRDVERTDGESLRERIVDEIQRAATPDEVDNIVQWMCANPSLEWPAAIYEINRLPDFPAKSMFMGKVDKIYESCSEMVADSDGQVDME